MNFHPIALRETIARGAFCRFFMQTVLIPW